MPPKPNVPQKKVIQIVRPDISNSSLVYLATDALEGFQERLDRCVDWTLTGSAIRSHKEACLRDDIPEISFGQAMQNKINKSFLKGFLNEDSSMSLQEHWDIILSMTLWDQNINDDETANICFNSVNNITDNLYKLIRNTVMGNDREILRRGLKASEVLRVNNSAMTYLDNNLLDYPRLTTLSLCGNYISELDCTVLPKNLRALEMQTNRVSNLESFADLPADLVYLGLAKNLLTNEGLSKFALPYHITVLDLSDNDICDLESILQPLEHIRNLSSLLLSGNPCAYCMGYATVVISRLQRLKWLDNRKILSADRSAEPYESHPDDLRSSWFTFNIIRIISAPVPPKNDKGQVSTFFVELELPLLDSLRRNYLMFGRYESLTQSLPSPEEDFFEEASKQTSSKESKESSSRINVEALSEHSTSTDIFHKLAPRNPFLIHRFTIFESNRVTWSKIMTFNEPTVRIFCPDLTALRNTFRSTITLRLMYSLVSTFKKPDKKSEKNFEATIPEQFLTIATIKCSLRNPDWSQSFQHFHWDDTLGTDEAMHWGDGDLSAVQYSQTVAKPVKGKTEAKDMEKAATPDNLTCHFSFSIDMLAP